MHVYDGWHDSMATRPFMQQVGGVDRTNGLHQMNGEERHRVILVNRIDPSSNRSIAVCVCVCVVSFI